MPRLTEIETRLSTIKDELGKELTGEQITALETEVGTLQEERKGIIASNEKRAKMLDAIATGSVDTTTLKSFPAPGEQRKEEVDDDIYGSIEYRKAFKNYVLRGAPIPAEFRADEVTKTTDVGSVIPTITLNRIIEKMEAVGMILPLVTRTSYKGGLVIPISTVKPVATWVAEGAGSDKQKKTTGQITFAYHKLRCAVAVTLEVDTMALSAFENALVNNVVEAMTKTLEEAIINGDGNGKPKGILKETPTGEVTAGATLSYNTLTDVEGALPIEYEGGAVYCMTKKTFMSVYGMIDTNKQPIGRVNQGINGRPERTLMGRPVVLCNYLPSFDAAAAGAVFAFLFNFRDYVLNTNYQMGIKRYEDNDTDDQVMKAIMLADGKVVEAGSLVVLKKGA